MLTTFEKLRQKPTEGILIPYLKVRGFININYKKMFEDGQSSRYMISLYSRNTFQEELYELLNNVKEEIQNYDECVESCM